MQTENLQVIPIISNSLHKLMKYVKRNQKMKSRSPLSRENSTKCLALKDMDMVLPMIQNYNINNQQSSKHASHKFIVFQVFVYCISGICICLGDYFLGCVIQASLCLLQKILPEFFPVKDKIVC